MYYRLFGQIIPDYVAFSVLGALTLLLLLVPPRKLLFLTLLVLLLPSLRTPLYGPARLLRWAFLAALIGQGILRNLRSGWAPHPRTVVHNVVLTFCLMIGVSVAWSIGPSLTLLQGLAMAGLLLGTYVIIWNGWETEGEIEALSEVLFRLAVLLFAAEFVYMALGLGKVHGGQRYSGAFTNPNGLGTAVAFLGPFVYWKHRTTALPAVRMLCRFLGLVMIASLLLSGSRSGLVGGFLCMTVIVAYVHRMRVVMFGVLVSLPFAFLLLFGDRLDTSRIENARFVRMDTLADVGDRLPLWAEGLDLFEKRPFLGYGYGMSKFADLGYANAELARAVFKLRGDNYHNAHLQIALDLGVVGLGLFWLYLLLVARAGFSLFVRRSTSGTVLASMAFFAAFLALSADSLVHSWAFSPGSSESIVFWIMGAAVVRSHVFQRQAAQELERAPLEEEPFSAVRA